MSFNLKRGNLLDYTEYFKPPVIDKNTGSILSKLLSWNRRKLDLQFGSIWRDLSLILPELGGRVLDVGCGSQPFRTLLHAGKIKYVGLDFIDAKSNFGYEDPDTQYYSGEVFPFEDSSFDNVLCTETLEHIASPSWFIGEINRVLKPNGTLIMTIPFAARWHFIPFDYFRYTPSSINNLLSDAYKNVYIYARGNELTVACYKILGILIPLLFIKKTLLRTIIFRGLGIICFPIILLVSIIGNISIAKTNMAADCLGFTIVAERVSNDK